MPNAAVGRGDGASRRYELAVRCLLESGPREPHCPDFAEAACGRLHATTGGARVSPGIYCRLLMVGYSTASIRSGISRGARGRPTNTVVPPISQPGFGLVAQGLAALRESVGIALRAASLGDDRAHAP